MYFQFSCYDLSSNYIVFGATSGGIYIFRRYPCKFIKLIPNKVILIYYFSTEFFLCMTSYFQEGAAVYVVISPDQKNIALSTNKGLIVIVQNCFTENNVQYQVYSQHEGNVITAMIWSVNDLYCGDNTGHVSVISFTNILVMYIQYFI